MPDNKENKKEKKAEGKKLKKTSKKYLLYEAEGGVLKRKGKFCPKCGAGVFLARHKDRLTCGKCGYTEFLKQEKKNSPS